jgi:hypothetical protein
MCILVQYSGLPNSCAVEVRIQTRASFCDCTNRSAGVPKLHNGTYFFRRTIDLINCRQRYLPTPIFPQERCATYTPENTTILAKLPGWRAAVESFGSSGANIHFRTVSDVMIGGDHEHCIGIALDESPLSYLERQGLRDGLRLALRLAAKP